MADLLYSETGVNIANHGTLEIDTNTYNNIKISVNPIPDGDQKITKLLLILGEGDVELAILEELEFADTLRELYSYDVPSSKLLIRKVSGCNFDIKVWGS